MTIGNNGYNRVLPISPMGGHMGQNKGSSGQEQGRRQKREFRFTDSDGFEFTVNAYTRDEACKIARQYCSR